MVWMEDNLSRDSWQCPPLASHPGIMHVPKDAILDTSPIPDSPQVQSPILSYQNLKFLGVQVILLPVLLTYTKQNHLSVMQI